MKPDTLINSEGYVMNAHPYSTDHPVKALAFVLSFSFLTMLLVLMSPNASAQGPRGKSFGIGFEVGEPTAVTARIWTSRANSWDIAIGSSPLGNPHIHGDYLWHFNDAFNSRIVSLYAGVGAAIGFGEHDKAVFVVWKHGKVEERWYHGDEHFVLAAKGVFALNIIPRNTPLDIFLELDPIIGLSPAFGFDIQPALGIRFYP